MRLLINPISYALFFLLIVPTVFAEQPSSKPVNTPPMVGIASAAPAATHAGFEVLREGGNAFDAAVAIEATLAVVEPYFSGLGGGGFWLLHVASKDGKPAQDIFIDGREVAPAAASEKMYLDKKGNIIENASMNGPFAAGIPGTVAALVYIAKHYGKLPLSESLAPAIRAAEQGFKVGDDYQTAAKQRIFALRKSPAAAKIFLRDKQIPKIGTVIKQPQLANTLRSIAAKGDAGFYQGPVAKKMLKAVRANGGIWTAKDLKNYKIIVRNPLVGNYHGIKVITSPPPSAGGVGIISMLNILAPYNLPTLTPVMRDHYIIEAMRRAYWQRAQYLGDPGFVKMPLAFLLGQKNADELRQSIKPNQATPSSALGKPVAMDKEKHHTTHYSLIDKQGNYVAATVTVNYAFGSGFVVPGTGVLLNDEMDDFATKPGAENVYGLVGSEANAIAPGKRPVSSMTPTFLETSDRVGVIGTPGGSRIVTMVLLGILDFSVGHVPTSWVSLPRFHQQYLPDVVQYEPGGFTFGEIKGLKKMGYDLQRLNAQYGNMQAVLWDKKQNSVLAASDPRNHGLAMEGLGNVPAQGMQGFYGSY